jgi:hypothetical protein
LSNFFCFTTKALGATFATNAIVHGVRIVLWEHCIKLSLTILYLPTLTSQWTPLGFEIDSWYIEFFTTLMSSSLETWIEPSWKLNQTYMTNFYIPKIVN